MGQGALCSRRLCLCGRSDIAPTLTSADPVRAAGRVVLANGTSLRALRVEPARLPVAPSEFDWQIVHLTLKLVDAKHCYRSLREDFHAEQRHMVPDL